MGVAAASVVHDTLGYGTGSAFLGEEQLFAGLRWPRTVFRVLIEFQQLRGDGRRER
jgi:hypothetical protein